ncbi:MAG: signal peptidase II [Acidimicrobiales bacterium]
MTGDRHHGTRSAAPTRMAVAAGVALAVVLADQLTKWWAVGHLAARPVHVVWRLDLALSFNTGSAFSLFQGATGVIVVVAVILVGILLILVWRAPTVARAATLGLILGGALGNLCDRFFRGDHGAVVDFVDFHFFPTFNVADSCITIGCILLALSLFRGQGRV